MPFSTALFCNDVGGNSTGWDRNIISGSDDLHFLRVAQVKEYRKISLPIPRRIVPVRYRNIEPVEIPNVAVIVTAAGDKYCIFSISAAADSAGIRIRLADCVRMRIDRRRLLQDPVNAVGTWYEL